MHGNLEPEERVWSSNIKVYSTDGCFYYDQMRLLMQKANLSFDEFKIDDGNRDAFMEKYPDAKGYPYVIIDDKPIGGLVETAKELIKKGFINAR